MSDGLSSDRSLPVFRHYLRALWRRAWIVVAVTAIVLGVGLFRSKSVDPLYQAQGRLELASAGTSSSGTDADLQAQIWIVQSPAVHEAATRATPGVGRVTARQAGPGNVIAVSATSADPKKAAQTVNATMGAYLAYVHKQTDDRAAAAAATALIQGRLRHLQQQIDTANANSPPTGSALAAS